MGQYFIFVNVAKREYVNPPQIAKLWEWCVNSEAGLLPYLLRKSDDLGGGDIDDPDKSPYAGRWAGDECYLVGDYDSSALYQEAKDSYTDITAVLTAEFDSFTDIKEHSSFIGSTPRDSS